MVIADVFSSLSLVYIIKDLMTPDADKVLTLLIHYDQDENLKVNKR